MCIQERWNLPQLSRVKETEVNQHVKEKVPFQDEIGNGSAKQMFMTKTVKKPIFSQ